MGVRTVLAGALQLPVEDPSQVASARREVEELTRQVGFDETDRGRIAIATTELAGNLFKHAGGGELLVRTLRQAGRAGIEILAIDRGPGMDVAASSVDGYSTAGSRGTGLGAIRRVSDDFDSYSGPAGTVILFRRWAGNARPSTNLATGVVSLAKPGSPVCGDGWLVEEKADRSVIAVADGLGHGPLAAEAAEAVLGLVAKHSERGPAAILKEAHEALRNTRGAAVAIVELDRAARRLRFAGLGNVDGRLFLASESHHLVSHNGTAGREIRAIHEYSHPWLENALLILHTDGMSGHWAPDEIQGLLGRDPALIAAVLYRNHNRGDDDVTALVVRAAG